MKDFETRLERLEALAEDIKRQDIKIEDAIKDFEEGIKLARGMTEEINAMEGKIQILMNDPLGGSSSEETEAGESSKDGETELVKESDAAAGRAEKSVYKAKPSALSPELSLFADADEMTGTSGEPEGGTRQ